MKAVLLTLALAAMALPALGEVTLYGREGFEGRSITTREPLRNLEREGFANRASSAVIRGVPYELCDGRGFEGRCVVLGPGRYPTLEAMGMNDAIVSLRPAAIAPPVPVPAVPQITLFGREGFEGRSIAVQEPLRHLARQDFNDRASSAIVQGGPFEICDGRGFEGRCLVLRPGRYPSLEAMGMNDAITSVRPVAVAPPVVAPPPVVVPAVAQITLFGREGFEGRSFATQEPVRNLERHDFSDRASSAIVQGGRFEICDGLGFEGRCRILTPGQYPSLAAMGMNDAITSVRPVERHTQLEERRFAPPPPVAYDYRPRGDERLFDAEVVAVRAVYGQSEERCWVEREHVQGADANPGRAIAGAIIGGILGHQVGSGRGNDAATAAGAVAGAAIGANYGGTTYSRDVQRCSRSQVSGPPEYWDVTYRFRGVDRYVQMTRPPGATITVNRDGEPRAG